MADKEALFTQFFDCCSCLHWATVLAAEGPYAHVEDAIAAARKIWWHQVSLWCQLAGALGSALPNLQSPAAPPACVQTPVTGWLEAFAAHPKIGDLRSLQAKYGAFAELSKGEQAAAAGASEQTLQVGQGWGCLRSGRS